MSLILLQVRKVAEDLKQYTCDAMVGKEVYSSYSGMNKARGQIKKSRLVFTTCIGAGLGLLRSEQFETVIVDEASQQTEPASLVPLVKGCKKAILVGDHVQLGPTVQKHAAVMQFDISLFERLWTSGTSISKAMLDTQYRMHESICKFSSEEFYEGMLKTGIPEDARTLPESAFPWPLLPSSNVTSSKTPHRYSRMVFVECTALEDLGQKSKSNAGQAQLTAKICSLLCSAPSASPSSTGSVPAPSIAILTPYSRQVDLLKIHLGRFPNTEVSSIDGFQGREADIVVFVTVRCNVKGEIGFLRDLRRLNVVVTRARKGVVVVGNRGTLTGGEGEEPSDMVWRRLLALLVPVEV